MKRNLGSTYNLVPAVSLDDNPMKVRRLLDKYGMVLTDVCAHSNLLASSTPANFSTTEIMKAMKFAAGMNVKYVITTEREPKSKWGKSLSLEESLAIVCDKIIEPLKMAQDYGISFFNDERPIKTGIDHPDFCRRQFVVSKKQ